MGWKSCYIIVAEKDCPPGYLGTMPSHSTSRANEIIKKLGYRYKNRTNSPIIDYPDEGLAIIGAYEKAAIIADQLVYDCFEDRNYELFQKALTIYPSGTTFILILHSVVNLYGYALYENGQLVREFGGSSEEEITHEFGTPLPEEAEAFARSKIVDGLRMFAGEPDENFPLLNTDQTPACYGEELAFMVVSRFYGVRPDQAPDHIFPEDLSGELLEKQQGFWQRLFR